MVSILPWLIYVKFIFTNRTSVDVKPGLINSNQTWFDVTEVRLVKMNFNQINLKSLKMNKNMQTENCQQTLANYAALINTNQALLYDTLFFTLADLAIAARITILHGNYSVKENYRRLVSSVALFVVDFSFLFLILMLAGCDGG